MAAGATNDSGDLSPLREADRPVGTSPEIAPGGKAQPKARTKRPRPTFDDGALTRVFKFPSKAYPRSSFYVTSTEIIIRIKKARKKWKLVVPKKRVASYRTNRWFAKPRWVEIELTYTQASRLGLVGPRTPSTEVASGTPAEQQAAGIPVVIGDGTPPSNPASEPDSSIDQPATIDLGDADFVSVDEHADDDAVVPGSFAHDASPLPTLRSLPTTGADVSRVHPGTLAAASSRTGRAAPKARAFLLVASLAVVLGGAGATWITLNGSSTAPTAAGLACAAAEQSPACPQAIVTGAIGKEDQPPSPDPEPPAAMPSHVASDLTDAAEPQQDSAPQLAIAAPIPAESGDHSAKVGDRVNETTATVSAAAEGNPSPAAAIPKTALLLPQDRPDERGDCGELSALGQSIHIPFDYASSRLKPAVIPALEAFAVRLRSCPATKVTIEGHTDSDGRAASNQSLSVNRAKAVLKHLVSVGAHPTQLSAIGFGQSRPRAPNVSAKNKRSNRRAALVVDAHR